MTRQARILAAAVLVLASGAVAAAIEDSAPAVPFPVANVHFEQNATDEDVEVVFEVKSGADGLAELAVIAPDGRRVVDFKAQDASTLGMRSFRFESPEPKDAAALKAAYPAGKYSFTGTTAAGEHLRGESTLSHQLPATISFVQPGVDASNVGTANVTIAWKGAKGAVAYVVEIEQEETQVAITARVPGTATRFAVPDGFLAAATEYHLAIGTVLADGNASFVETSFTTAAK